MKKRCPLNGMKPCHPNDCGFGIENNGKMECAVPFIGHELFVLADVAMQSRPVETELYVNEEE